MTNFYRPVGAFWNPSACDFIVWSPEATELSVVFESGIQPLTLTKDDAGYWTGRAEGTKPGDTYHFHAQGGSFLPDPASKSQPSGVSGPSAITDRYFEWDDEDWKPHSLKNLVIYELHVGTFTTGGDFAGVISRLPYLQQLGVNAIELMPIAQFSGTRNWGYDGVFPFAAQNTYGGYQELKKLVNAAHLLEISVILDVVYNHAGPEGDHLSEWGPYYSDAYKSNWGRAINFDGPLSDGVRNFFLQNALQWLDEFHIDGLRLDAVHAIFDYGARHFIQMLQENVSALAERVQKPKLLIAEIDLNKTVYIDPPSKGGYGLDAQWADEFHHALHVMITGEKDGYYEDFGSTSDLKKAMSDSYVYTGQYSAHRRKNFGQLPLENPYSQFIIFAQNHDQTGNRLMGERLAGLVSFEQVKLSAAVILLAAQVPLLFMGEEYGETRPFQYFADHADATLKEAVRKGRKKEFAYFRHAGEAPDPFAVETFNACKLSWNLDAGVRSTLSSFYRELIHLRKTHPALQGRTKADVTIIDTSSANLIAVKRTHFYSALVVCYNFSDTPQAADLAGWTGNKDGTPVCIFDSADSRWGGKEPTYHRISNGQLTLEPFSAVVYELNV